MTEQPTSAALARPPRKIAVTVFGRTRSAGNPIIFNAVSGRPPMAKMSESELAAAICPYENGSSTIGVKKSTVCTRARCRSRRYTPASSNVLELTSTFRFNEMGSCGKTWRRACWLNFDAHPAQDESDVSLRICSRDMRFTSLPPIFDFELRFAIGIIRDARGPISTRKSQMGNEMAERIGIE